MEPSRNKNSSIFFNQSFDKKRLKALISWVFKKSGEAEALKAIDFLKETGFRYATKAGISIGLHDLTTPIQKSWLISESQLAMNTTNTDFSGARITATERSQRIIDTWHRASESLSKQVVDYFGIYDRFNPVYIMALSGARGNFSQVRQLIGMRGLMADQQGKIVNFPIRSNLREGLTLTEYFISCSGARKGLVDTALRTADTGYLTRRLVDVSHHVVVKRIRCNTNRGIDFRSLQSYNKVLLSLKERLVGRVLAEDIAKQGFKNESFSKNYGYKKDGISLNSKTSLFNTSKYSSSYEHVVQEGNQFVPDSINSFNNEIIAKKDQEISLKLASKIVQLRDKVYLRSPLTCGFTHSVCQLCYGWSISQGSLVSLGDAVGVIAAQSIGEPGTQLTMRTFHTGGVFSGDLLQEIRAPHAGKIEFSKAFQGLLIRTAHGRIAFLSKTQGSLILSNDSTNKSCTKMISTDLTGTLNKNKSFTDIPIPAFTMLFVRQGEKVEGNQLLAEFSIRTKEGNQPIKTQQTIFAHLTGKVIEDCSGKFYTKPIKESALLLNTLQGQAFSSPSGKKVGSLPRELFKENGTFDLAGDDAKQSFAQYASSSSSLYKTKLANGKHSGDFSFLVTPSKECKSLQKSLLKSQKTRSLSNYATYIPFTFTLPSVERRFVRDRFAHFCSQKKEGVRRRFVNSCTSEHKVCTTRNKSRFFLSHKSWLRSNLPLLTFAKQKYAKRAPSVLALHTICKGQRDILESNQEKGMEKGFVRGVKVKNRAIQALQKKTQKNVRFVHSFMLILKWRNYCKQYKAFDDTSKSSYVSKALPELCACKVGKKNRMGKWGAQNDASPSRTLGSTKLCNTRPGARRSFASEGVRLGSVPVKGDTFGEQHQETKKKLSFSISKAQILSAHKNEDLEDDVCNDIEPVRSGRLGFLKILSTRLAATFDYTSPIKSFTLSFVKGKNIESLKKGIDYTNFGVALQSFNAVNFVNKIGSYGQLCITSDQKCISKEDHFWFSQRWVPKELTFGERNKFFKDSAFRNQHSTQDRALDRVVDYPFASRQKNLKVEELESCFSSFAAKYLHPEFVKENRFFLQTIAEYGDIVDETYKNKRL